MDSPRYELRESDRLIATGTVEEIIDSIEELLTITPNIPKLRESLKLTDEYVFGLGVYEITKIS